MGAVKSSIKALSAELEKRQCTLGQYFHDQFMSGCKVRNHYVGRNEHYVKEFDRIAEVQGIPEALAKSLSHALFSQRPLRSQKNLVGNCVLEKSRSRCMISHPLYEKFRMLAFVNTIRVSQDGKEVPLNREQRAIACKAFLRKTPYFDFSVIRKAVFGKNAEVDLNYADKTTIGSSTISHKINEVLGCDFESWRKSAVSADGKAVEYDYQALFDALAFFDDDDKLRAFAINRIGLEPAAADRLVAIHVRDGYAAYSLFAIRKIIPFLEEGRVLSEAVFFAKLPDILGAERFASAKTNLLGEVDAITADYRENKKAAYRNTNVAVVPLQKRLKTYLSDTWGVDDQGWSQLYLHTEGSAYDPRTGAERLPVVNLGMIRNPLVQRSLTTLRRLVNHLRKTGKIDADTIIHIELARSVNNRNTRMAIEQYQKEIEASRQDAVQHLHDLGLANPTDDQILKYMLCEEQGWKCLYTGRQIEVSVLLNPDTPFDIEHTIPRSRSGDDSQRNKTVCDAKYNRDVKKGRLPTECPNYEDIEIRLREWKETVEDLKKQLLADKRKAKFMPSDNPVAKSKAVQKAIVTRLRLDYWRTKLKYFTADAESLSAGFMNRQLVDTGVMSRHALDFLHSVYPRTYAVNGVATAWARKTWGVQGFYEPKSRDNHTHHAIDAMVIAALDRESFNKICARFKDDGTRPEDMFGPDESMKPFAEAVRRRSETIVIRHLPRHTETKQTFKNAVRLAKALKLKDGSVLRKVRAAGDTVRGQLHKESYYGKIMNPNEAGAMQYVIRKPVNDATTFKSAADFDKIVDPAVRRKVAGQVAEAMAGGQSFKDALQGELWMKRPENGAPGVRINKVRIKTAIKDPQEIRLHSHPSKANYKNPYYAESGGASNFMTALYEKRTKAKDGTGKRQIVSEVVNLLDWAQQHKRPDYVPPETRTELGTFIGYVETGALALAYKDAPEELQRLPPGEFAKRVYRVVKFNSDDGRITLRLHTEARDSVALAKTLSKAAGESSIDFEDPHPLLFISSKVYTVHLLFEGIDFDAAIDGTITFRAAR